MSCPSHSPDLVTASTGSTNYDINTIISKVNTETNRRYTQSSGNPGSLTLRSRSQITDDATIDQIINRVNFLNTRHCYCENHNPSPIPTTRGGGPTVTINSVKSDFEEGLDFLAENPRNTLLADVQRLQNQCSCHTFTNNNCTCNNHICSCQNHCECDSHCQCQTNCNCHSHCICNLNKQTCSPHYVCGCDSDTCSTNCSHGSCSCYSQCSSNCSGYSAGSCSCENVSSCTSNFYDPFNEMWTCTCVSVNCPCNTFSSESCSCNGVCSAVSCTCDIDQNPCFCNSHFTCSTHDQCPSNCSCQTYCSCNKDCSCNNDCGCNNHCNCNTHCQCQNHCTCHSQCNCEFN